MFLVERYQRGTEETRSAAVTTRWPRMRKRLANGSREPVVAARKRVGLWALKASPPVTYFFFPLPARKRAGLSDFTLGPSNIRQHVLESRRLRLWVNGERDEPQRMHAQLMTLPRLGWAVISWASQPQRTRGWWLRKSKENAVGGEAATLPRSLVPEFHRPRCYAPSPTQTCYTSGTMTARRRRLSRQRLAGSLLAALPRE